MNDIQLVPTRELSVFWGMGWIDLSPLEINPRTQMKYRV